MITFLSALTASMTSCFSSVPESSLSIMRKTLRDVDRKSRLNWRSSSRAARFRRSRSFSRSLRRLARPRLIALSHSSTSSSPDLSVSRISSAFCSRGGCSKNSRFSSPHVVRNLMTSSSFLTASTISSLDSVPPPSLSINSKQRRAAFRNCVLKAWISLAADSSSRFRISSSAMPLPMWRLWISMFEIFTSDWATTSLPKPAASSAAAMASSSVADSRKISITKDPALTPWTCTCRAVTSAPVSVMTLPDIFSAIWPRKLLFADRGVKSGIVAMKDTPPRLRISAGSTGSPARGDSPARFRDLRFARRARARASASLFEAMACSSRAL